MVLFASVALVTLATVVAALFPNAMSRIAETKPSEASYRALAIAHPAHPLAAAAEAKLAVPLTGAERIERAKQLDAAHLWDQAVAELGLVGDDAPDDVRHQRDYWLGTALYDMRRRYADAAKLLLAAYPFMADKAPEAMFHGARALSRADHDDDAISWYHKVVAAYPNIPSWITGAMKMMPNRRGSCRSSSSSFHITYQSLRMSGPLLPQPRLPSV